MRVALLVTVLVAVPCLSSGCGGAARPRVPVTVLVVGTGKSAIERTLTGQRDSPLELRFVALPNQPARPGPGHTAHAERAARVADARQSYIDARFAACVKRLDGDVSALLGDDQRGLAERTLFWRIACHVGAGEDSAASRAARAFAVMELDVPPDVASATPEVEALLSRAGREVEALARITVRVTADVDRARLAIDGRARDCVTPCSVELIPGDHVFRVDADGAAPAVRVSRVDASSTHIAMTTTAATPEQAARQWSARYAASPALDTVPSMRLLARAVRGRNVVLLGTSQGRERSHLRGTLAVNGDLVGRSERSATSGAALAREAPSLLDELLVRGQVLAPPPPLYRRKAFWLAVGSVAVIAAGLTGVLLYQPDKRQVVTF